MSDEKHVEKLERALLEKERTIEVLMEQVESGFSNAGHELQETLQSVKLEKLVEQRTRQLETALQDLKTMQSAFLHAQKMESIGQLAAGIAHEINTPMQYIGGNVEFLKDALGVLTDYTSGLQDHVDKSDPEVATLLSKSRRVAFVMKRAPRAIEQTLEGVSSVNQIVGAMKEFSHPGNHDKVPSDINHLLRSAVTVCRNEWKYVAEIDFDLQESLPQVPCLASELNQVVVNIIVNAAQAISETLEQDQLGTIAIRTRLQGERLLIQIADNGPGVPEKIQNRIFDPFFTTKEVGKGTGQGLAIAHSIVRDKHNGEVALKSSPGNGAEFSIWLPVQQEEADGRAAS